MLYAILCYNDEAITSAWTKEEDDAVMARLQIVHEKTRGKGQLGPAIRLLPTTSATTLRKAQNLVIDGPYAETKEQLLGFYIVDVQSLDEALQIARDLGKANPGGAYELRPISIYQPGKELQLT
ncbi:MAG TPA: YciI family protein [Phenylobacterium sp.]|uniref:YciI family protein n=1 Tax=Phenylobacterium sp. TaxID=1871053 RepID=UPI002F95484F